MYIRLYRSYSVEEGRLKMDILRRNTDYALRAIVNLAKRYGDGAVSTRTIADDEDVPYQLACKLMQKLHKNRLVESCMGPKGGFRLSRSPSKINVLEVIEAIQGAPTLNKCLLGVDTCPRKPTCPVSRKLAELQVYMNRYLSSITLSELVQSRPATTKKGRKNPEKGEK